MAWTSPASDSRESLDLSLHGWRLVSITTCSSRK